MKKTAYILFSVAVMLASCTENEVLVDNPTGHGSAIEFAYSLPINSTRTVISSKNDFPIGGVMAVDGFQTSANGEVYQFFKNDSVWLTLNEEKERKWKYNTTRFWDTSSTYKFYAMYPYEVEHSFDTDSRHYTINNFVVANSKDKQKDVMIAGEENAMPEDSVTFGMHHLLSQVNFYLKADSKFNTNDVESIELKQFDLFGVKNTGTYTQTGFDVTSNNVEGSWTVADEGEYDMPEITSAALVTGNNRVAIESGLLMLPQDLKQVKAKVSYRIHYVGGTTASYSAEVPLSKAMITKTANTESTGVSYVTSWLPNYVYNYNFGVNPSTRGIDDFDVDIDGTIGGDGNPTPDVVIVIDPNGNWWVDEDGDGIGDTPIVWEDIDGDGRDEGGVDRDGDGHIDNSDGENENPDSNPVVTDGDNDHNPNGGDVILVDTDGDGVCETQLERDGDKYYPDPERNMNIEFSAEVEDFETEINAEAE